MTRWHGDNRHGSTRHVEKLDTVANVVDAGHLMAFNDCADIAGP
jgi:hypothetical protein